MSQFRTEHDSLGDLQVPAAAYYGAQTQRAIANFPISGQPMPISFVAVHATLKKAAAMVNRDLGLLDPRLANAIIQACQEIRSGDPRFAADFKAHFPVDIYQTGSGTSTNMNLNEVIANRANEILEARDGNPVPTRSSTSGSVHPNDHVNLGQSSNDTIPTTLHVLSIWAIKNELRPGLEKLRVSLLAKSKELWPIIKTGRTHLQDATPIRLGQEFLGYAGQLERSLARLDFACTQLAEVPLGGTAVGTGINAHPEYAQRMCQLLSEWMKVSIRESTNHFQAQSTLDAVLMAHGVLRTIAVSLTKIANDIRWMGSGPRAGLGEIELPAVQPGSSIMPGKVNPVIAESLLMVCQRVLGNDAALVAAATQNNFELAMSIPLAAAIMEESICLLGKAAGNFATQCIAGIRATDRGPALVESGLMLATALAPALGYEKAAAIAKEAAKTNRTIRDVAREMSGLSEDELTKLLDPEKMVGGS